MRSKLLSVGILSLLIAVGFPLSAEAAGATVQINQTSTGEYGQWTLNGATLHRTSSTQGTVITNVPAGTYTFTVKSPAGSRQHIDVTKNSVVVASSDGTAMNIVIADGDTVKISVMYAFSGTISVTTDTPGVSFSMQEGTTGIVRTGTTPARFTDLTPGTYTVYYDTKKECQAQKNQMRELPPGGSVEFYAIMHCGTTKISLPGSTNKPLATGTSSSSSSAKPVSTMPTTPAVRIIQQTSASEAVAGSKIRVTLTVRNVTHVTLHDLSVVDTFDASLMSPVDGNTLTWSIPSLYAGQTWTVSFDMMVAKNAKIGERGVLSALVGSPDISGIYPDAAAGVAAVSIAAFPQTGEAMDLILAAMAMAGALLLSIFTIRRSGFQVSTVFR